LRKELAGFERGGYGLGTPSSLSTCRLEALVSKHPDLVLASNELVGWDDAADRASDARC